MKPFTLRYRRLDLLVTGGRCQASLTRVRHPLSSHTTILLQSIPERHLNKLSLTQPSPRKWPRHPLRASGPLP